MGLGLRDQAIADRNVINELSWIEIAAHNFWWFSFMTNISYFLILQSGLVPVVIISQFSKQEDVEDLGIYWNPLETIVKITFV